MRHAYYNENDPFAAQWLRNLIAARLIPAGEVDARSIRDVQPEDLRGFRHCHFFAGIGGWALALQIAGWDADDTWTGSCPCQPFSHAGKRRGFEDDRHLWPEWHRLIDQRRPATVFGEQVANAADWVRLVRGDLEALAYAVGAIPFEAACVGALHRRDRWYFVAHADSAKLRQQSGRRHGAHRPGATQLGEYGAQGPFADADCEGQHAVAFDAEVGVTPQFALADTGGARLPLSEQETIRRARRGLERRAVAQRDWWAVEPALGRVAHGVPGRVGMLRGFGNAIVPQAAAEFIRAARECMP